MELVLSVKNSLDIQSKGKIYSIFKICAVFMGPKWPCHFKK